MGVNDERAARLQAARARAGFKSAREAALRLHWTYPTYAQHENGQRGIKPDVAEKYAAAFGADAGWIMYGIGRAPAPPTPRTTPAPGLSESDLAPYNTAPPDRQAMMRQIARAVSPADQHPTYYIAQRTRADLMIAKGDIVILSLDATPNDGDTVIVQLYDEAGDAVTQLRQYIGQQLVADRDTEPRTITAGAPNVMVRGTVAAVIRTQG